ncbi:MAG TPA: ATP-binding protein [Holophagaceae bacterium]|jgi:signal transduction histidine kinase|nr:ATP-binding protein [Holophagaceae bacterium]
MLRISIKTKLTGLISLLVLSFLAFNVFYYPRQVRRTIHEQALHSAQQVVETASYALSHAVTARDAREVTKVLQGVQNIPNFAFSVVFDSNGKALDSSPSTPGWVSQYAKNNGVTQKDDSHEGVLAVAAPVFYEDPDTDKVGTLVIGFTTEDTRRAVQQNVRDSLLVGLGTLILGIGVAVFLSNRYLQPVVQLTKAAQEVASGQLDNVVVPPARTHDELEELGRAFQVMTDKLRVSRDEIERQNRLLEYRVQERTRQLMETIWELEEIRSNLEQLVQERTRGLEQSRGELRAWAATLEEKVQEKTVELKQANASVLDSYEKLKEVDRLKDEFRANMSHELRTPLNAIIGFSGMLMQDPSGRMPEDVREDLRIIYENGQNLLAMINQVLDLSKFEAGKMQVELREMDPIPVVEDVRALAAGLVQGRPVRMVYERPPFPVRVMGDPDRLRQVFTNLVGNAVKFTEEGEVAIEPYLEGGHFKVRIRDTGIGMTEDEVQRLFQPFQQVDGSVTRRFGGTGLGLAISQRIMEFMNGEILVESGKGKGSSFTVTMPALTSHGGLAR